MNHERTFRGTSSFLSRLDRGRRLREKREKRAFLGPYEDVDVVRNNVPGIIRGVSALNAI
jgi:hypothetical protein